eukprot:3170582-Rhodomonas_salina.4
MVRRSMRHMLGIPTLLVHQGYPGVPWYLLIPGVPELRNAPLFVPAVSKEKKNGCVIKAEKPSIDELWHPKGYTLLYETSKPIGPHCNVVLLECVLGICLLMLLYHNVTGTIPVWAGGQQKRAFQYGHKLTEEVPGSKTQLQITVTGSAGPKSQGGGEAVFLWKQPKVGDLDLESDSTRAFADIPVNRGLKEKEGFNCYKPIIGDESMLPTGS